MSERQENPGQITFAYLRDRIWTAIRRQREFTVSDVHGALPANSSRAQIYNYVRLLERAGYVERCGTRPGSRQSCVQVIYRLCRDIGIERPQLSGDGAPAPNGQPRERLWRTIKILKEFSIDELAAGASTVEFIVRRSTASKFIYALTRARYLVVTQRASRGTVGRWRAVPTKVRGPRPPVYSRRDDALFDPNTGETIPLGTSDE